MSAPESALAQARDAAARAGAHSADSVCIESDSTEVRVRGEEIEHVKQARERTLGLRVFVNGGDGLRQAVTSTSDLSETQLEGADFSRANMVKASIRESQARGARFLFLEVRESNEGARGLYAKVGFEVVGVRKDYYHEPVEDAIVMKLDLSW